ncbi:Unknown protein sequence [Pseudomonas syringae pv. cilantro]|uniref:Uncharacterized protein n=1 Tax=Pseudomonas syringae pv. cilantro TaxID=81035 RepID=A0A0N1JPQ4_PSESX|nr:Unknown protein sequence [Pseudomonas syringae pv. cilantro]
MRTRFGTLPGLLKNTFQQLFKHTLSMQGLKTLRQVALHASVELRPW